MTDEKVKLSNRTLEQGYQALANAIVVQACEDYRRAIRNFDVSKMYAIRRFFHSRWYEQLTNVNGDYILKRIEQEEIYGWRERRLNEKLQRYDNRTIKKVTKG